MHDRNAAEALRGILLEIDRPLDESPEDPDEFYDDALEGCRVELTDGAPIGVVREVIHLPGQDLLAVVREDESEVLVPFVQLFVPVVDVIGRRIIIDPPMGLLEDVDA